MECELCGRKEVTEAVVIDGCVLKVCSNCAKFGSKTTRLDLRPKVSSGLSPAVAKILEERALRSTEKDLFESMPAEVLALDYNIRIRNARIKKGLTPMELGKLINEKRSVINNLESGIVKPDDKLVAKLERALGIKLKEKPVDIKVKKKPSAVVRLGDLIEIENK